MMMNRLIIPALALLFVGATATLISAQTVEFGDNTSEYARDGECDDRRFIGVGMASDLDEDDNYHDAKDCKEAYADGRILLWNEAKARAATQCSAIQFGDDTSEWEGDGECDDPRFEGPGSSSVVNSVDIRHDARDCRKACNAGRVFVRDY